MAHYQQIAGSLSRRFFTIQGDGYNALWQEVDIAFNSGFAPHQFLRDDDVESAASGPNPEITLVPTNEIYRCDILQQNKPQ